jgi:hypothetical protein
VRDLEHLGPSVQCGIGDLSRSRAHPPHEQTTLLLQLLEHGNCFASSDGGDGWIVKQYTIDDLSSESILGAFERVEEESAVEALAWWCTLATRPQLGHEARVWIITQFSPETFLHFAKRIAVGSLKEIDSDCPSPFQHRVLL